MHFPDTACAIDLLVVGLLVTQHALFRHRLCNYRLIRCWFASWPIWYGPRLPKIGVPGIACAIIIQLAIGLLAVGL